MFALVEAIRELGRLSAAFCSVAVMAFDLELIESLPSLEPLLPLSPALHVVVDDARGVAQLDSGPLAALARAVRAGARRASPSPIARGLDESQHARTRLGVHYSLGLLEASMGIGASSSARRCSRPIARCASTPGACARSSI